MFSYFNAKKALLSITLAIKKTILTNVEVHVYLSIVIILLKDIPNKRCVKSTT